MNIIEDVYNSLKDKYNLILTNTMALNEGFTIDTPVIVGQNENDKFWLYSEGDGSLSSLVFLIRYYNRFHTNKEESIQYTHWHPMTMNSAIYGIERFFKKPYIYWHAHNYCNNNRSELKITNRCGCFYCCRIYHTNEIKEWIDSDNTALCPYCGIDSVLPENDTYSLTDDFLTTMRKYWFESVTCGDGTQIFCEDFMRTDEFNDYIQKGLGRAILLLRAEIDKTPFLDAVWKHALNDMRYDSQCSSSRGHYIKELFECFDNSEELFYELFRIYSTVGADSCYRDYYIDNLYSLAIEGVIGASDTLDTLYGVLFDKLISSPNPLTNGLDRERDDYSNASRLRFDLNKNIAESLIMDALTLLERSPRFDMLDLKDLFITLNDKNGIFNAAVEKVKNENTKAKETLDEYENHKRSKSNCLNIEKDIKPTNWKEALEISASNDNRTVCFKKHLWENLSDEDRIEIARLLEDKTDKKRRFALLCNLERGGQEFLRNYPCDPSPLIAELEDNTDITFPVSPETILHRRLSNVVSQIVHPAVREFAIRNLPYYNQKTNSISHSIAFTAFLNNYHPEDEEYIYELVTSITDTDHLHAAGMDLLHADAPISERVLIYLYENTPCSICRCSFFNSLMVSYQKAHNTTLDSLPAHLAAIKEEAKHDCEQATRYSAHARSIEKEDSDQYSFQRYATW